MLSSSYCLETILHAAGFVLRPREREQQTLWNVSIGATA